MAAERREYEMTQEDLDKILKAITDAQNRPLIMLQTGMPPSIQAVANDAWKELGDRMGFDHMSVMPNNKGQLFFTAVPRA